MRRSRRLLALAAVGSVLLAPMAARAATVPADGVSYGAGTQFTIPCVSPTPRPNVHALISSLERADPKVPLQGGYGVYPTRYNGWANDDPTRQTHASWNAISPVATNNYEKIGNTAWSCNPTVVQADGSTVPGSLITINQPGYYHLLEFDVSETHTMPPPSTFPWPPDTASCPDDIGGSPYISAIGEFNDGKSIVTGHCRHYVSIYFTVYAYASGCPGSAPYVKAPYINQYDWGQQHGGPPIDAYGQRGGNACGASSLNMMLGTATPQSSLYDDTAAKPPANGIKNWFDFNEAEAILQSQGYKQARVVGFSGAINPLGEASENSLSDWLKLGPVLTSTQFGAFDWSRAGDGHVVLVTKKLAAQGAGQSDGDYIVSDPAGDYFINPSNHYGPGRCGYQLHYPISWVAQLTYSRWGLLLGKKSGPRADAARGGRARNAGHTAVLLEAPNGVSVWVQDRAGHRAGFVGPGQTLGLSGITLNDAPTMSSDPAAPFGSTGASVPDRGIIVLDPGKGLTLVATGKRGRRISARMIVYRNGARIMTSNVRASLRSGATVLLSLPSAGGHNAPVAQLNVTVKLGGGLLGGISVSARAPFAGFASVTVTQGARTVGAGAQSVKAGPFSLPVFLFPGTKGQVTVTIKLAGSGRTIRGSTTATV